MYRTQDLHVKEIVRLLSPRALKAQSPTPDAVNATVRAAASGSSAFCGRKTRACSSSSGPARSTMKKRAGIRDAPQRAAKGICRPMEIVMRVYFEKPRTTIGWKGLINDPHLDGSQDIETGLKIARKLLLEITGLGLPAATEFLDPIVPQYIADLITWAAIGARTTESQTHREMASGLSMPVGLKNSTDGSLQVAIDAMGATRHPHSFLGINEDGVTSIVRTTAIRTRTSCCAADAPRPITTPRASARRRKIDFRKTAAGADGGLQPREFGKEICAKQEDVWRSVIQQRIEGTRSLIGLMVESHLHEGNQPIPKNLKDLRYGVSITDSCIGWETTERMLRWGYETLGKLQENEEVRSQKSE
jgi:3-deoxy-7-phosphoheptulonate synthase